jgi:hypothetical protein
MLNYNELKNKAREFLAATGLKPERFEKLLPAFRATYGVIGRQKAKRDSAVQAVEANV